jgi:hypothetical protein
VDYVAAFGLGVGQPLRPKDDVNGEVPQSPREAMQQRGNVPSRAVPTTGNMGGAGQRNVIGKGSMGAPVSYIEYPGGAPAAGPRRSANFGASGAQGAANGGNIPSRTGMFRGARGFGIGLTGGSGNRGPRNGRGLYTR